MRRSCAIITIVQGEAARDGDRIWRPDGDDLWDDPRALEPDRPTAPIATALVDVAAQRAPRTADPTGGRDGSRSSGGPDDPKRAERPHAVDPAPRSPLLRGSRLLRAATAVALIAALVVAAVAIRTAVDPVDLSGDVAADAASSVIGAGGVNAPSEPFAGADPRRLPDTAPVRWSRELDLVADRGSSLIVHRDEIAIGIFATSAGEGPSAGVEADDAGSTIVGLDTRTGDTVWTADFATEPRSLDPLGVIGDVLVIEWLDAGNRALIGLEIEDGTERWRLDTDDSGIHGIVPGTDLITRFSFSSTPRLTFIDPGTGELAGRITGRFVGTDYAGRWWLRRSVRDGSLSVLDLRDGFGEPAAVGEIDAGVPDLLTVVGGVPVGTIDGRIVTPDATGTWVDADIETDVDPDPPDVVFAFSPAADDLFVFAGSGSIYGAVVVTDDDADAATIDVRWRLGGRVARAVPSDRGLLLLVEDQGGTGRKVVDGPTGRVLVEVEDAHDDELLELVGNGFLTVRSAEFGVERVAFDLQGRELWTIVGAGPLDVGEGVVVNWTGTATGVRVTAFG